MLNETRVNLKHLLEDIRDSYTSPLAEVILTELVANALDSKAGRVEFTVDPVRRFLRCTDDGLGMKRLALREYHNIAASAKPRGLGIGFAGVGAKLSLLLAEKVITESKGGHGSQCATEWQLAGLYRAPWKFTPFQNNVTAPRGTAVSIYLVDGQSPLLEEQFVRHAIIKHFYPLLNGQIRSEILKFFYKKEITFFINGEKIVLPEESNIDNKYWFRAHVGKGRHPAGVGFLSKIGAETGWLQKLLGQEPAAISLPAGLCVSTFGKIIKGGWEWVGISPKNAAELAGVVEIPALSEILTTNKNDFLSDSVSLKKYYKFRKAVQEAVLPVLRQLGEQRETQESEPEKFMKPLNQAISGALNNMLGDFPELESLIGAKNKTAFGRPRTMKPEEKYLHGHEKSAERSAENQSGESAQAKPRRPFGAIDEKKNKEVRIKTSGLKIRLAEITSETDGTEIAFGRIIDDILTVNTKHPAWEKAKSHGWPEYHILLTVGVVLSQFLEAQKSPQEFLNSFFTAWAKEQENKAGRLF